LGGLAKSYILTSCPPSFKAMVFPIQTKELVKPLGSSMLPVMPDVPDLVSFSFAG